MNKRIFTYTDTTLPKVKTSKSRGIERMWKNENAQYTECVNWCYHLEKLVFSDEVNDKHTI